MDAPYVHKIFTGKVKQMGHEGAEDRMDRPWNSGIFKQEAQGERWLGKTGFMDDEVADTKNHGGPEKAVFAYPKKHYEFWRSELDLDTISVSAMGENLSLENADEYHICIGDTFQFGESVIQVSQPRQPCWKPARRFRIMDFALRIQNSGRTGWYFRVLKEGKAGAGMHLELIERPLPQWTIAACNEVMHVRKEDLRAADDLASCGLLAENWRRTLTKRLRGQQSSVEKRVFGPNKS
ncbi:MOSC domain-containing protein [Virgibacillus siamensis]|uniref:MOSC domain-containing protein n=1 Tax=Virgibacillus siamensis TaxID=480071 RepID=UPI000984CF75|nr:MOSC domain-containing protein [Virgibacillus siamensis]